MYVSVQYVTFQSVHGPLVYLFGCFRGGRIGTQNHIRAVTSRVEIGLVSPVIRRRSEGGKGRKLEERKRPFHHHCLHQHNNFISNARQRMRNRTAVPLWNLLKLIEYLYADFWAVNFLSFLNSLQHPISHPPPLLPCPHTHTFLISGFRIAFVRIWHYFHTSESRAFLSAAVGLPAERRMWTHLGQVMWCISFPLK